MAMNEGHSAAWDQSWERAASFYRQALEEIPDHPQALTSLGLALFELHDYEAALRIYQKASRFIPEDPIGWEKIAQCCERLGMLEKAIQASHKAGELYFKSSETGKAEQCWLRVARLDPENLHAHARLALVYERNGEKHKAVSSYLALASLLQTTGELQKAHLAVNRANQILPNNPEVAQAQSSLLQGKPLPKPERPKGGTGPLRMAQVRQLQAPTATSAQDEQGSDPVSEAAQRALTSLAGFLFETSSEEPPPPTSKRSFLASIAKASDLLSRPPDRERINQHLSQMIEYQTQKAFTQAAGEMEKAIDAGLDHPAAYFNFGYLLFTNGQYESALRKLRQAVKHVDFSLAGHLLLGEAHYALKQFHDSAIEFLEALKYADLMMAASDQAEALTLRYEPLSESLRQDPNQETHKLIAENIRAILARPAWRENLERARQQMLDGDHTTPLAEMITEAQSSQVINAMSRINNLAAQGKLRSAMEESFFTLQQAPTFLPLHIQMGDLLVKQGNIPEAAQKFTSVARVYTSRGEFSQAVSLYRKINALAPLDIHARSQLIELLISNGQHTAVIDEYLELADAYYRIADLVMARKTYNEALRLAQEINADRSKRISILHHIADIDLQSLDWRQAIRVYEQIRSLQPSDEKSRIKLIELHQRLSQEAQSLAEINSYIAHLENAGQQAKALAFLETLVAEYPNSQAIRLRLAEYYRQSGRHLDAITLFDQAQKALLQAGDKKTAIQVIESILALDPPNKTDYLRKLAQLRKGN